MPKDLRDIINEAKQNRKMPEAHRKRFEQRLERLHEPKKKSNFFFLKMAASLLVLVSLGSVILKKNVVETPVKENTQLQITSLGSISPELQKVENYYVAAINYELASLEQTPENKAIVEVYLEKIGKLSHDYKRLTKDLAENGLQEKTVNALITNLQLQLQLLIQLKDEINELKMTKEIKNENTTV